MFTKSQLVAAAVLVASASSVMASSSFADVTDIEARNYERDALSEIQRRTIMEYLEDLEARGPNDNGPALGGQTTRPLPETSEVQQHSPVRVGQKHKEANGHVRRPLKFHPGRKSHPKNQRTKQARLHLHTPHHSHNRQDTSTTGRKAHQHRVQSDSSENPPVTKQHISKRSFEEYLEDLEARAPGDKVLTQAGRKNHKTTVQHEGVTEKVSVAAGVGAGHKHKGTEGHNHHSSGATPANEGHPHHGHRGHKKSSHSNHRGERTLAKGRTAHSHKTSHGLNDAKQGTLSHHGHEGSNAGKRLAAPHGSGAASSNTQRPRTPPQGSTQEPKLNPPSGVRQKVASTSLRSRELEELAELIARELDVYDDLD